MGRKGLVAVVLAAAAMLVPASSAHGAYQWSDGLIEKYQVTNCPSTFFPPAYQEDGGWAWTGQYIDPNNFPGIGETFYVHIVVALPGNPCPGGAYGHIEITPPSGVSLAITGGTPVFCYAIDWRPATPTANQEPAAPTGYCPQTPQTSSLGYGQAFDAFQQAGAQYNGPWPMGTGTGWEIQIPVTSSRVLNGGFGACADCIGFGVRFIDGNPHGDQFPHQGLFVDNTASGGGPPGGTGGTTTVPKATPRPASATPATPAAPSGTTAKKCKKNQKLKKGKCVKKKRKKKK